MQSWNLALELQFSLRMASMYFLQFLDYVDFSFASCF